MFEELEKLMKENQEVLIRMKNEEGPRNPVFETDGTHNGDPVYCPVNAYGDCPYCDQCNLCHIADPVEECSDFGAFFESWDEWVLSSDDNYDYDDVSEIGYNPYLGCYDDDC